nr:uncharacterized protein CTRU02_01216 [Colletotrichum truncatum]KAF6800811.1 hypothetical protein CTRU02_01216 [Colletotrichum truncatum]
MDWILTGELVNICIWEVAMIEVEAATRESSGHKPSDSLYVATTLDETSNVRNFQSLHGASEPGSFFETCGSPRHQVVTQETFSVDGITMLNGTVIVKWDIGWIAWIPPLGNFGMDRPYGCCRNFIMQSNISCRVYALSNRASLAGLIGVSEPLLKHFPGRSVMDNGFRTRTNPELR